MKVLLSIKPEYAEKIFNGTKRYEFRRILFKNKSIRTIIVYASSPVQQVIGEFEIEYIINDEVPKIWNSTKEYSGISETSFYKYFSNLEKGFAIKIKETKRYEKAKSLKDDFKLTPPQSFLYIK